MKKAARRARLETRRRARMTSENPLLAEYVIGSAIEEATIRFNRQQAWFRVAAGPDYIYAVVCATLGVTPPPQYQSDMAAAV